MDSDPAVIAYIEAVKIAAAKDGGKYVVGVDVGGTNTRVAISSLDGKYVIVSVFKCSTLIQLLEGLNALVEPLVTLLGLPSAACMDIAGPVSENGTKVTITNYAGTIEERTLTTSLLPPQLFPIERTRFVNDLESCCYGVLGLEEQQKLGEFFEPLWGDSAVRIAPVHHAVLAAGTGLGVGLLIKLGARPFQVYPIEYGHAIVPPLGTTNKSRAIDQQLLDYLSVTLYGGKQAAEYEDIVSGRGLAAVYDYLVKDVSDVPRGLNTAEIAKAATAGNLYALKAVEIHYRILVRAAQNICVGMNVKGVFFAGDNQVDNSALVKAFRNELQEEFLNHPKREWIENLPVYAQSTRFNINLYGTIYVARLDASQQAGRFL